MKPNQTYPKLYSTLLIFSLFYSENNVSGLISKASPAATIVQNAIKTPTGYFVVYMTYTMIATMAHFHRKNDIIFAPPKTFISRLFPVDARVSYAQN